MQNNIAITAFYLIAERNRKEGKSRGDLKEILLNNQGLENPLPIEDIEIIIEAAWTQKDCPDFHESEYNGVITMIYATKR